MFVEPEVETYEAEAAVETSGGSPARLPVFVARPGALGEERRPGLLLIQEAFGVNGHIRDVCRRYARQGYIVVSPDLYYRTGAWRKFGYDEFEKARPIAQSLTEEQVAGDLGAALNFLAALPSVDADRLGVLGYCLGGRLAFYTAGAFPDRVRAAAVYYGGGIVADHPAPGWSMTPIERTERIRAPLIGFFGGQDAAIPKAHVERIDGALAEAGIEHAVYFYPEAGHGFFCDARPSFHPGAAEDAWHRTLHWFEQHLGPVPEWRWPAA